MFHCEDNPLDDQDVHESIRTREETIMIAKENLSKAVKSMKCKADSHRADDRFEIRELVLVKLHKYRQNSAVARKSNTLERRFFGPFPITEKISEVAL